MSTTTDHNATSPQEAPGGDRVREHTDPDVVEAIDRALEARVRRCADEGPAALTRRIDELEHESDIERVLEANASTLVLLGLGAAVLVDRRFLALPAIVAGFLLQHALQGWCPPVPLFRRLGVRTRQEIDAEKFALKAVRGDYAALTRDERRTAENARNH